MTMSIDLQALKQFHPGSTAAYVIAATRPARLPRQLRWLPDLAPTPGLADWLHQRSDGWSQFCEIYWAVLDNNPQRWLWLAEQARQSSIVLLSPEEDLQHSAAAALLQYLQKQDAAPGGQAA